MKLDLDRQKPGGSLLDVDLSVALAEAAGAPDTVRLAGQLKVENLESRLLVRGSLQAAGNVECDRCLESFPLRFAVDIELMIIRDAEDDGEPDSWIIHQKRGEVDLTEPLREAVLIALPQKMVCRDDCLGLCPQCGSNRNRESCNCNDDRADPRWDGLPDH